MTSVATAAAWVDDAVHQGLNIELSRDPADLWQTMTETPDKPCDSLPPETFFPLPGRHSPDLAERICASHDGDGRPCAARAACLAYALKTGEVGESSGVWGGTLARDRVRLRNLLRDSL